MKNLKLVSLRSLIVKTAIVYSVTYFAAGVTAMTLLGYGDLFENPNSIMKPVSDPMVMAGFVLQPVRGLIFALAIYPVRDVVFGPQRGWLVLWWLLVSIGILSTFGPAPGSIEGMIYTKQAISIFTYVEIVPQALSLILYYWVNYDLKWLTRTLWFRVSHCHGTADNRLAAKIRRRRRVKGARTFFRSGSRRPGIYQAGFSIPALLRPSRPSL